MKKLKVLGIILVALLVGAVFTVKPVTIKTGEVGVVSKFGKVTGTKEAGLSFIFRPTTKVNATKVTQDKFMETYDVSTKDLQTIGITIAVQYAVDQSMVVDLYSKFHTNYVDGILAPKIAEAVNSTIAGYSITEVISERVEIANTINNSIVEELGGYGIRIVSADITDHKFSSSYEGAVDKKMSAQQETLAKQEEVKQAELAAERNRIMAESYTKENYIREFLDKWDGILPQVVGEQDVIIDILNGDMATKISEGE